VKTLLSACAVTACTFFFPATATADPAVVEAMKNQSQEIRQEINDKKENLTHASDYLEKKKTPRKSLFQSPVKRDDAVSEDKNTDTSN